MAIDLTGITNENEFYTHHYLAAILENDLKTVLEAWAKLENPPYEGLKALAKPFQTMLREPDRAAESALRVQWFADLFAVLGYSLTPEDYEFEDGTVLRLAGQISKANGQPELWILSAAGDSVEGEDEDPLEVLEETLTRQVFAMAEPPRWVLVYGTRQVVLVDRTKWPSKRFLRFELDEILSRREASTLRAMAALLHRDSVCPANQISLLDRLDENSHSHAFAVSKDLKYSVREAVELIGNEVIWYLREQKDRYKGKDLQEQISRECLRYLYRLLFLFFVEAREELAYAPMKSEEYRTGYSLESLREAAEMDLDSEEDRNGYYLHQSIQTLFRLIHGGWRYELKASQLGDNNFQLEPLQCDLFDPARMPLLTRVRLRNHVLQQVIGLLSMSREQRGRARGRISYAQLGISQLGSVYEGLLSYSGFLVEEADGLYEVKPEGEAYDPLKQAYFVPKSALADYKEGEKVYDERGRLVHHPQGAFVYRLAGRNRQKSASYYTPDVLTQCTVKYALKELLQDKSADDILGFNVCEPAMGSGAFLNEAVNQLSDAYLERKQRETGRVIPHDQYTLEKQKVKAYLADNRVYGVDRNPVAIELAEISLWLNTIYKGHTIPWFGGQLAAGNSLIGARRQVFTKVQLEAQNREWLGAVPERVPMGTERKAGQIWHFLVPDEGMADYTDKAVKEMLPAEMKQIREWRKEFTKRFTSGDTRALGRLSEAVDRLWKKHCADLRQVRRDTAHVFPIFGQDTNPAFAERGQRLTTRERDEIFTRAITPKGGSASAYQRLKLAMDYWCALWFWPVEEGELLPTRDEFLLELASILEGTSQELSPILGAEQQALFATGKPEQSQLMLANDVGSVDLDDLCGRLPRLKKVLDIAARHRYLHWELEFADLFDERGGFDLLLGNPPWIKVEWNEGALLSDVQPLYLLRAFPAAQLARLRDETMTQHAGLRRLYLDEYVEFAGAQAFFNATQNYPLLLGSQSNTFKCFVAMAWNLATQDGVQAFVHPEGLFDDPKGGVMRAALYPRLRFHFHFRNELPLFAEVHHNVAFSVNIYGTPREASFLMIANLFVPATADASFAHDGSGLVPGIKTDQNDWDLAGHSGRVIEASKETLGVFSQVYDPPGTPPLQARLPALHARLLVDVLRKVASASHRISELSGKYVTSEMWHETNAVKEGLIGRNTSFPASPGDWIISGPHIHVSNPFSKTPRSNCTGNQAYQNIELTHIPEDYLPRTNYLPKCEADLYAEGSPIVPWDSTRRSASFYRLAVRKMIWEGGERTLISALIPPYTAHIHGCISIAMKARPDLLRITAGMSSLAYDFLTKSTGKSNFGDELFQQFPLLRSCPKLFARTLLLNCLTRHFGDLWRDSWGSAFCEDRWAKDDPRLKAGRFARLTDKWSWDTPVRTAYERRQAQIEIDVLVARQLGLTLLELCTIYRIQFPVLRQYENNTWYDGSGNVVYLDGDQAYGISTPEWKQKRHQASITRTIQDDTLPGGPRERTIEYVAPFDRCDREADYATAWKFFDEAGV